MQRARTVEPIEARLGAPRRPAVGAVRTVRTTATKGGPEEPPGVRVPQLKRAPWRVKTQLSEETYAALRPYH